MYQTLKLFSFIIAASLMLTSCHLKNDLLDKLNQQDDDKEVPCGTTVTAVRMSCAGYGAFDNVYFLTDKGEYLQPWELFPTFQAIPQIVPGKKYTIGYQEVKRDKRYDSLMRCKLYDERVEKATAIKLTCLVEQNDSADEVACGLEVTAVPMSCAGYGAFGNIYFITDKGEYIQPWEMFPTFAPVEVKAGKRYIIGYKKVTRDNRYSDSIRCMLYDEKAEKATPVKLTCLSETACANIEATVSDKRPVDGCLEFVLNNGERLLADISHLNITLQDGERVRFAYTIEDGIIPCGTRLPTIGKVARVKCIERTAN